MTGERFEEVACHFSEVFPGVNVQDVRPGLKTVLLNLGFGGDNNWCVSEALPVDNPPLSDPPAAKRRRVETEGAPVEKASEQEVAAEPEVPVAPEAPVPVEPQVLDHEQDNVRAQVHAPPDPEVTLDNVDNGSGDHPDNPPDNSNDEFPKRPTIDQAKVLISKNGWNKLKPRRVCQLWDRAPENPQWQKKSQT